MDFGEFIKTLINEGLEYFNLYYSDYEGHVADSDDPENRGRIKVSCPAIYGNNVPDIWALPKGMFSGKNIGFYAMPQKGDPVWISFRKGNAKFPIWQYGWIPKDYAPEKAAKDVYIFQTPKGYKLVYDEKDGEILVWHSEKNYIRIKDKISIYAGGENMFDTITKLLDALLIDQNILTTQGPGEFNPATKLKLKEVKEQISKLLE